MNKELQEYFNKKVEELIEKGYKIPIKGYCKDCKHCELDIPFVFSEKDEIIKHDVCRLIGYIVNKNDYCSRFEEKS